MVDMTWLLLTYKVPADPATKRVALWRRLKSIGAIYLQNGICLLPKTDDHVRRLKMLENDIAEMGGEAVILETVALDQTQERSLPDSRRTGMSNIASFSGAALASKPRSPRNLPSTNSPMLNWKKKIPT